MVACCHIQGGPINDFIQEKTDTLICNAKSSRFSNSCLIDVSITV